MKKRNQWLTNHPIQAKYLLIVALAMLGPSLVIGACFYHLVFKLLADQIAFPEAIQANLLPVIRQINLLLLTLLPGLILIILWLAVAISHRFAGPVERLERELDAVVSGASRQPLHTRKNDDLAVLVQKINRLIEKLNG